MNPLFQPHPVLQLPTQAQAEAMGPERLQEVLEERQRLMILEKDDPYRHGFEPDVWKYADDFLNNDDYNLILLLGGNRASKSEYCASRVCQTLAEHPQAEVCCWQTNEASSVEIQQSRIHRYLPLEWRQARNFQGIRYSEKNGFTGNRFVTPNRSKCYFRFYTQALDVMEGAEYGPQVGIWMDELAPLEYVLTGQYRNITRAATLLLSFTPILGWTSTIRELLTGAKTIKEVDAELLPLKQGGFEKVPRAQIGAKGNVAIIYFHTQDNPYGNYAQMKKTLAGETRSNILCRGYGIPQRAMGACFPRFGPAHRVKPEDIPAKGTNYMICDPADKRNFFMIWVRVAPDGKHYVYREWPCPSEYIEGVGYSGPWAEPHGKKMDGMAGPAQELFGFGLKDYADEIKKLEKDEEISGRFMDSRFGAAPTPTNTGNTTLIELFEDFDLFFEPTAGVRLDEGIAMVNDLLAYNPDEDISPLNCPKLYVSEKCENVIFGMSTWTNADGKHGAVKDPCDTVRYAALLDLSYLDKNDTYRGTGGHW